MDGWNRQIDRNSDRRINCQTDRWTDAPTDGKMGGKIDRQKQKKLSSPFVKLNRMQKK